VRGARVWARLLGVENTVVQSVVFDEQQQVMLAVVRPMRRWGSRCGVCRRRCAGYDRGQGVRRWRALDLGTVQAFVQAEAPRVSCAAHGVVVAAVPWARHGAGHTYAFEQTVAWLATVCAQSAVTALMRIAWRTVGAIVTRVWADTQARVDLLAGLRRIGIDEISYRKGYQYLMVVVDLDTGSLVWAGQQGNRAQSLAVFFDLLGPTRCAQITHVSSDSADWITRVTSRHCPKAIHGADPFHVVTWAIEALDGQRRAIWNAVRGAARGHSGGKRPPQPVKLFNHARWALRKNPGRLTENQHEQLAWIAKTHPSLHRGWRLKEALRTVFVIARRDPAQAIQALDRWIGWARRCRLPLFVKLAQRITRHRPAIVACIQHRLSNGIVESTNTKIRLIIRRAFGFHSAKPIIALAMLTLSGHRPNLPR